MEVEHVFHALADHHRRHLLDLLSQSDGQTLTELSAHLRENSEAFDLIVSADTLVYFGDLKGVIAALAGALRPKGMLVFTLEHAAGDSADAGFRLELHGRYSHTRAYVEQLLTTSGLQSKIIQAELRMEAGAPVNGLVVYATKSV